MPHARFVDRAREVFQRGHGAIVDIEPVKKHRFVLRKKMKIIIEDDEVVFLRSWRPSSRRLKVYRASRQRSVSQGRGPSHARFASVSRNGH